MNANPAAIQEEMEAAARAAFIHERILQFPDGYDTVVGERGYRLSGSDVLRLPSPIVCPPSCPPM